MNSVYLETSALLKMLFSEDGWQEVTEQVRKSSRVVTSRLTRVEAERAIVRLRQNQGERGKVIAELERELKLLWPRVDFLEITREVCDRAGRIAPTASVRSLDAIHLATYAILQEMDPLIQMLTFDERIKAEVAG